MRLQILVVIVFFALSGNVFAQSKEDTITCDIICPQFAVIDFTNTIFLSKKAKLQLDSAMKIAKQWPMCRIMVIGYGTSSVESQQHSWDKVASVILYLKKKGIQKARLIFDHGEEGNPNTVCIWGTRRVGDGFSWVPPPHPQFSLHKRKVTDFYHKYLPLQ